jgi:hypothetical protein
MSVALLDELLAARLTEVIPRGVVVRPVRGGLELHFGSKDVEFVALTELIDVETPSRELIAAATLQAVNSIQDAIAVSLRSPWPGTAAMPNAHVEFNDLWLQVDFRDAGGRVVERLQPIQWSEIE